MQTFVILCQTQENVVYIKPKAKEFVQYERMDIYEQVPVSRKLIDYPSFPVCEYSLSDVAAFVL